MTAPFGRVAVSRGAAPLGILESRVDWPGVLVWVLIVAFLALMIGGGIWWQLWTARKISQWNLKRYRAMPPESRQSLAASISRVPGGKRFLKRAERDDDESS